MKHHISEAAKHIADAAAGTITVGAVLQYLPYWAATFTIIWTGMRMFDWIEDRIEKRQTKKRDKDA